MIMIMTTAVEVVDIDIDATTLIYYSRLLQNRIF